MPRDYQCTIQPSEGVERIVNTIDSRQEQLMDAIHKIGEIAASVVKTVDKRIVHRDLSGPPPDIRV